MSRVTNVLIYCGYEDRNTIREALSTGCVELDTSTVGSDKRFDASALAWAFNYNGGTDTVLERLNSVAAKLKSPKSVAAIIECNAGGIEFWSPEEGSTIYHPVKPPSVTPLNAFELAGGTWSFLVDNGRWLAPLHRWPAVRHGGKFTVEPTFWAELDDKQGWRVIQIDFKRTIGSIGWFPYVYFDDGHQVPLDPANPVVEYEGLESR